jgi:NTP pyrophosphatase (non-canonical NTP hydrolase)
MGDVIATARDEDGQLIGAWRTTESGEHRAIDTLTFSRLREVNIARAKRWHPHFGGDFARPNFPRDEWTGADWSNAMCGEAGEAANVVKKLRRYECGLKGALDPRPDELRAALAEEIADVVTYADLLAAYYGIDVDEAVATKFNKVSERQGFPERLP